MVEAGHDVIACAPEDDDGIRQVLAALGVRYQRTPMQRTNRNPFADLLTLASYIRLFRAEHPDVVLAYTQKPIIYGGIAARIALLVIALPWTRPLLAALFPHLDRPIYVPDSRSDEHPSELQ